MITTEFESLLKTAIGLDAASIGVSAVERAVQERMTATGATDAAAYAEQVRASPDELQALVEAVVVPETWFFRDREAFAALARLAFEEWLRAHPDGVLRIASLPCSTGEEPYSMAMALLDAGFPANRFRVDAVDISLRALAFARRGIYGKNSFRGGDLAFRERHFEPAGRGWALRPAARAAVHFEAGNLLDPALLAGRGPYDVIFCRNVLIYFDRPTQDKAVAGLLRLLAPNGFLFVGPSETGLMLSHNLDSAKIPLAFAFRRPTPRAPKADIAPRRRAVAVPPSPAPRKPSTSAPAPAARIVSTPAKDPALGLDAIAQLADQGHLAEAARLCEEHLRTQGASARAFHLLGLVRDAAGKHAEAAALYRKALYLEPTHHEALVHLAVLLERNGDTKGAQVLAARARRAETKAKV